MAKKPEGPKKIPIKLSLLTAVEKEEIRKQARATVLAEMEQDARDEYFKTAIAEARRDNTPQDQIIQVVIDIAPFLPHISIDGVMYFHGYEYSVPRSRALVMYEQMQRSWQHQDEIDGRSRFNPYRRAQNTTIGPRDADTVTRGMTRNSTVSMPADAEV